MIPRLLALAILIGFTAKHPRPHQRRIHDSRRVAPAAVREVPVIPRTWELPASMSDDTVVIPLVSIGMACPNWWHGWNCSREDGHTGRHAAAGVEGYVYAVWEDPS